MFGIEFISIPPHAIYMFLCYLAICSRHIHLEYKDKTSQANAWRQLGMFHKSSLEGD